MSDKSTQKLLEQAHTTALTGVAKSIKSLKIQIRKVIAESTGFKRNYDLLKSVPGIGHFTVVYLTCSKPILSREGTHTHRKIKKLPGMATKKIHRKI